MYYRERYNIDCILVIYLCLFVLFYLSCNIKNKVL